MPKLAEINIICREIGRENVYYEPEIMTEVKSDGKKLSKIVVAVYADRNNKDSKSQVSLDTFTDHIYFDVKELYEQAEQSGFPGNYNTENDSEVFGWSSSDSWHLLGNVYYFLLSVYNLIEGGKELSPIIDTKGGTQGKLQFSVGFEIYDTDKKTKLNALEYDSLSELVGRNLKLIVELKRA